MSKKKRPAIVHYALPHNVVQPAEGTPNHYSGWGPHVHDDKDKAAFEIWAKEHLGEIWTRERKSTWPTGEAFEDILWRLADAGVEFSYAVDQWAGVMTKGKVNGEEWTTWVEGDSIFLALAETYRWWFKEKKIDRGGPTLGG